MGVKLDAMTNAADAGLLLSAARNGGRPICPRLDSTAWPAVKLRKLAPRCELSFWLAQTSVAPSESNLLAAAAPQAVPFFH